jgi:hypothetical protein
MKLNRKELRTLVEGALHEGYTAPGRIIRLAESSIDQCERVTHVMSKLSDMAYNLDTDFSDSISNDIERVYSAMADAHAALRRIADSALDAQSLDDENW